MDSDAAPERLTRRRMARRNRIQAKAWLYSELRGEGESAG
jgi:hypothetical protein